MSQMDLSGVEYFGADLNGEIVADIKRKYSKDGVSFARIDIVSEVPPKADLILCRDLLVHLSFDDIGRALSNMRQSGASLLLTTTFTRNVENTDIPTGSWRPLNLTKAPFNFPAPIELINEGCTEGKGMWMDKSLGLFRLADL